MSHSVLTLLKGTTAALEWHATLHVCMLPRIVMKPLNVNVSSLGRRVHKFSAAGQRCQ